MMWGLWSLGQILAYWWGIKWFHRRSWRQRIYEDSPQSHQQKQGTPTMGGLVIFIAFTAGAFVLKQWTLNTIWIVATTALFALIGLADDALAIKKKHNKGLSAKAKFGFQVMVAILLVGILYMWIKPLHWIEACLYVFLLVGTSNATNLTDGLDGLLGTTMLISLTGMMIVFNQQWMFEERMLTIIMMAAISFFLLFNWFPAKVFMGDVGSLMLGGFLAALAIISGKWQVLIGFGAIYIIETLSVIIQVVSFKLRQKRVFLMSPLHHHFELLGLNDIAVVILFSLLQTGFTWLQIQ